MKKILSFSPRHGEDGCVSRTAKCKMQNATEKSFCRQKIPALALALVKSRYCDTPNSDIIFVVSGKSFEMGAGTGKAQFGFDYGHKSLIEVRVYFKPEIQLNIFL